MGSWANPDYQPCAAEVHSAASLVTSGYLEEDVIKKYISLHVKHTNNIGIG